MLEGERLEHQREPVARRVNEVVDPRTKLRGAKLAGVDDCRHLAQFSEQLALQFDRIHQGPMPVGGVAGFMRQRMQPQRSCAGRSWLVSMMVDTSRSSASSSRSSSIASTSARCRSIASPVSCDSGCSRRVSENRRTSVSLLESRKIERINTPSPRSWSKSGINCGNELALRESTAMATRRSERWLSSRRNSRSNSGGRLSTQKKPASSSACSATDLPEPEMPVTSTTS